MTSRRALALFLLLSASVASGGIHVPEVLVVGVGERPALVEGEPFELPIEIVVTGGASLASARAIVAPDQAMTRLEATLSRGALPAGAGITRYPFTVRGVYDPGKNPRVEALVGGIAHELELDLFDGVVDEPIGPSVVDVPRISVADLAKPAPAELENPAPLARSTQDVWVSGRITFEVQDGGDAPIETHGADGATIVFQKVRDVIDDLDLGVGVTDANGDFGFRAQLDGDGLYVIRARAKNGSAVNVGEGLFFGTYEQVIWRARDFTGSTLDVGTTNFALDRRMNAPLLAMTTITRAHRWYDGEGIAPSRVTVRYPNDISGSSFYLPVPGYDGINLTTRRGRDAGTILHEYGHHWVFEKARLSIPGYCNDVCDDGGCGHCLWCEEDEQIAWSEGFASFISWHMGVVHSDTYGWVVPSGMDHESILTCQEDDVLDPPGITEGYLAALAQDLIDVNQENDGAIDENSDDRTVLPEIFPYEVASNGQANSPAEFVVDAYEQLLETPGIGPADIADYWSTVRNNGLLLDDVPPTAPTRVTSPSHPIGTPSPSALPTFIFEGAADAESGVEAYYVDIHTAPREPASGGEVLEAARTVWPNPLSQGDWYANVRSIDAAGNESLDWISYGPFTVDDPVLFIDLRPVAELFYEAPLIVRNTRLESPGAAGWQPNLLPGDAYASFLFKNDSLGSTVVDTFAIEFRLDSLVLERRLIPGGAILPGQLFELQDVGPFTLPPGRHTISAWIDPDHVVNESNGNNISRATVIADPVTVTPGNTLTSVPVTFRGPGRYRSERANQSAFSFTPQTRFTLISAAGVEAGTTYKLRAYEAHTSPFDGLETQVGRTVDRIGAWFPTLAIIDRDSFTGPTIEVGIGRNDRFTNRPEFTDVVVSATNIFEIGSLSPTQTRVLSPSLTEELDALVFQFDVGVDALGFLRAELEADIAAAEGGGSVRVFWIAEGEPILYPTETRRAQLRADRRNTSDAATLDLPRAGKYLLVVAKDATLVSRGVPVQTRIELERIPRPELELPTEDPIWDISLLPTPSASQDDTLRIPEDLIGESASTFVNFSLINSGAVTAPAFPVEFSIEGEALSTVSLGPIPPGGRVEYRSPSPVNLPSGRRTLAVNIDPAGEVEEFDESNNVFALQFGWNGPVLNGQTLTRPTPPEPNEFRDVIRQIEIGTGNPDGAGSTTELVTRWAPQCDGLRLDPGLLRSTSGTWVGAAILPKFGQDYDLKIFDADLPSNLSFVEPLATSTWPLGRTEFVLVSGGATEPYDLGVYATSGTGAYDAQSIRSEFLGTPGDGFTLVDSRQLPSGEVLDLFEFELQPGTYTVNLFNQSVIHLGMSVHAPLSSSLTNIHSKDELLDQEPNGWGNPAGQGQTANFVVTEGEQGRWVVAVWRQSVADSNIDAFYSLEIETQLDAPATVLVDGWLDSTAYGYSIVTQEVSTAFGDNSEGGISLANGSELNQGFGVIADDKLYLMLTGNLESNGNDLEIFLDTRPGGMNRLRGDLGDIPTGGLARMGDDGSGNGLTFDSEFAADYYISASGTAGDLDQSSGPYLFGVQMAEITETEVEGRELGFTVAGPSGRLYGGSGVGSSAPGNLLVNPSFESPAIATPDAFGGGDGWSIYGSNVFTVTESIAAPHTGTQGLKLFGSCCNGVYQEFPTSPGEAWIGSAWVLNEPDDPLLNGQVGSVAIEWFQADGVTQSVLQPFVSNGETDASTTRGQWIYRTIRGVAPDDAAFVRFTLITGDFLPGGPGGAVFFDDATFQRERGEAAETTDPNPFGVLAAINNLNTAGVGPGVGADSGAGTGTGMEFGIPLEALGNPQGCILVAPFINGSRHDFVSNQTLGPLPIGTGNLGDPRNVDFGALDGSQYFQVCPDFVVSVDDPAVPRPTRTAFHEPTPNPFNPRTTLAFSLTNRERVQLTVYAANGRRVRELLAAETFEAGRHEVVWDGTDVAGQLVSSGVYFARLQAGTDVLTRRMVLLK